MQLTARVKQMYPIRQIFCVVTSMGDVDALLATRNVGLVDPTWAGAVNIATARVASNAKKVEYVCVCGKPLRVQVIPGDGSYEAHC